MRIVFLGSGRFAIPSLESLIRAYWKPVYFFVRRKGHDAEGAKDLVQGFFAALLYWFPKMFGKMYSKKAIYASWFPMFVGFNMLYFSMLILGLMEQINLAHGSLFALGAYFAYAICTPRLPLPPDLVQAWAGVSLGVRSRW